MHPLLRFAQTPYVQTHDLMPLLAGYAKPRDWIARLVKKGELIRLKNGFFVIAEKIEKTSVPYEQIANLLYGPSYISFEWALSYYGLIPEGVYVVTSATVNKTRSYKTPLGTLDYFYLSHERYAMGITQQENAAGQFLIATPEKALADLVHFKARHLSPSDLLIDLIEARRMDEQALSNLDKKHLCEIADRYRSEAVHSLAQIIGKL